MSFKYNLCISKVCFEILERIESFRKRNMNVIDGLKSKLVREKLYPDTKHLAKAKRKAE